MTIPLALPLLATLSFLTGLARARPAGDGACWTQVGQVYSPRSNTPPGTVCREIFTIGIASYSDAQAIANGVASSGNGQAWDVGTPCEARVQTAAATGIYSQAWQNACGTGEIEFFGEADITGVTHLIDDDCSGAALGYQQIRSSVLANAIAAALTESAGETHSGELGSVSGALNGLEVSVPITFGLGEGTYQDNDQDLEFGFECENFFTIEFKSRSYIRVWANSTLFDLYAEVQASMNGTSDATFSLGTCPE